MELHDDSSSLSQQPGCSKMVSVVGTAIGYLKSMVGLASTQGSHAVRRGRGYTHRLGVSKVHHVNKGVATVGGGCCIGQHVSGVPSNHLIRFL